MPFEFVTFGQRSNGIGLKAIQLLVIPLRGNYLKAKIGGYPKRTWDPVAGRCLGCRTAPVAEERQGAVPDQGLLGLGLRAD